MRALTRKALIIAASTAVLASVASALPVEPLWGFSSADSTDWRGDTLSIAMRADLTAVKSFYLENDGGESAGPFTLELTSNFYSGSGGSLPASALSFNPGIVPILSAGATSNVEISIHLSSLTPPEIYHAEMQALLPDFSVHSECVLELRVRNDENLRVAPNPCYSNRNSHVDFRIASQANMNVSIDLFTMGMDKVRTLYGDGPWSDSGVETLSWDLLNEAGNAVASGMYLALARFEVGGERFTETHRVMIVH
jgi:hypothetical protein